MEKKVGIIGCGAVTEKMYLPTFTVFKGIKVAYLADKNQEQAQKLAKRVGAEATDLKTLRQNSDIIIICTPPESHYGLVKESILPGKTIICEKPFMPEATKVAELLKLAANNNALLYVAHFRRTFPSVVLARQLASTTNFGLLKSIMISEGGRFNWESVSDYYRANPLGGVAMDTGSHTIDMALYVSGLDEKRVNIIEVTAKKDKSEPSHEVDANLKLEVDGNIVMVNINLSRFRILANQIVLFYEHGNIVFPTSLGNYVKIERGTEKTIVYAQNKIDGLMDAFQEQYKYLFNDLNSEVFSAHRFENLTAILENINKA